MDTNFQKNGSLRGINDLISDIERFVQRKERSTRMYQAIKWCTQMYRRSLKVISGCENKKTHIQTSGELSRDLKLYLFNLKEDRGPRRNP